MLKRSWIRSLSNWLTALSQHRSRRHNPQRNRSRQVIEALECRMLLSGAPVVTSINLVGPATTDANKVTFTATFSEPVTGVDPTDFALVKTGTVSASLSQVTAVSPSVYTVTVSGITGDGALGLNLVDDGSIRDVAGNRLTGTASFAGQSTFSIGAYPQSMTLGDMNGDGKLDLAVVNFEPEIYLDALQPTFAIRNPPTHTLSVFLGTGNGTFQTPKIYDTGEEPSSVVIGDVNGDGKPDLVVANLLSSTLSVFMGNGDGTFHEQRTFATGTFPNSMAIGDVNGDGKLDLATSNRISNSLSVLLGNGDGTFQAQQPIATGLSVTLGDVNGDGKPDLIVADEVQHTGTISVLLGNGDGTFQSLRTYTTAAFPNSLTLKDVNGDGKPDLAFANRYNDTLSILSGNGDGTFQGQQTLAIGSDSNLLSLGLEDLNGDNKLDLVFANNYTNTVSVLLGNGNGTFHAPKSFASGKYTSLVTVGDVDGDGNPDLIVAGSSDFSSTLSVLLGNGNGTFQPPQSFAVGSLWSSLEVVGLMAGDLNGDGTPDIVVTNNGYEYLYLDCGFENTLDAPGPLSNAPDVSLIPLFYSHSTVSVLLGKGNGNFTGQVYAIVTPPSVTKQPLNTTVKSGAIASFTVAANGSPTPTVQWQVSTNNGSTWSNIAGETKATYSFTTALGNSGNQYRAVFTNQAGTVTSKAAKLTMRRP